MLLRAVVMRVFVLLMACAVHAAALHAAPARVEAPEPHAERAHESSCAVHGPSGPAVGGALPGALLLGAEPGLCMVADGLRAPTGPRDTRLPCDGRLGGNAVNAASPLRGEHGRTSLDHQVLLFLAGLTGWHTTTPPPLR